MSFGLWEVKENGNNLGLLPQIAVNVLTSNIIKYTLQKRNLKMASAFMRKNRKKSKII